MKNQSSKKSWLIISGIIIIAIIVYFMFFSGTPDIEDQTMLQMTNAEETGMDVLSLLNQIQSLRIDSEFFDSTVYKSLQDYSVAIPTQDVGRDNPFAPI
ncbi:MAG: hypothetical protein WCW03_02465 [Candidatus Paceibacterota bacterium]|jgi:hypothetical protein